MSQELLANLWAAIIGLILALYVALDGFDLGIGVLSLFTRRQEDRQAMMSSIGAFWDANETWLVIAGGALFGAFPTAYGVLLNALYVPIMMMLFGLVFRAVSFEFRGHSRRPAIWEFAFGAGSLVAVVGHGFALGGLLSGIKVVDGHFAGGPWDWFSPLPILTAVAVGFGYVILGASYLLAGTEGPMHRRVQRWTVVSAVVMFAAIAAVTVLMPLWFRAVALQWTASPMRYVLSALSFGAIFAFVILILATFLRQYSRLPFVFSLITFFVAFAGLLAAMYPYIVPTSLTIQAAAADSRTLVFMLFGIALLIPVMLAYNLYLYRVFLGRRAGPHQESY